MNHDDWLAANQDIAEKEPWLHNPQSIRAVLFDVGFTLLYPHPSTAELIQSAIMSHGFNCSLTDVQRSLKREARRFETSDMILDGVWTNDKHIQDMWLQFFSAIAADIVPPDAIHSCALEAFQYSRGQNAWRVYDDVAETLDNLYGHVTLGIVSDWSTDLGAILRKHHLLRYFDVLIVSAAHQKAKPDPRLFETALERANALGDYAIYIGDSYLHDVLGARASNIHPVLLDRGKTTNSKTMGCPVISSLAEVPALLDV